MSRRRNKRSYILALIGVFMVAAVTVFVNLRISDNSVGAAALSDYGNVMSDYTMRDYNSMSEAEIQAFLTRVNSCNNTSYSDYVYLSSNKPQYTWHWKDGHFVCISEERFEVAQHTQSYSSTWGVWYDDFTSSGRYGDALGNGEGGSAAHIIYMAAQEYKINPKVIITFLQKEQGLITDPIPNNRDYGVAMGYNCPDSGRCPADDNDWGFSTQVFHMAKRLNEYMSGDLNYHVGQTAIFDGQAVYIKNTATAALYTYTPHISDKINLYRIYTGWFEGITDEGREITLQRMFANMVKVPDEGTDLDMEYSTHIASYGWLDAVGGGEMAGTTGYSLRVEALKVKLSGMSGIEYRTHVQDEGWGDYRRDGEISGSTGKSRRIEALQIRLTDKLAKEYDVYYRVHASGIGWMNWSKNDEIAGTTGQQRQIEAIQIRIVKKDLQMSVEYRAHVANIGWMNYVGNNSVAGTTGQSKRVEAFDIKLSGNKSMVDGIRYRAHVADIGWMNYVGNNSVAGTTGQSKRVEAFVIELINGLEDKYNVYYRAHVEGYGWMEWMKNGEVAGTIGQRRQVEAMQIRLEKK